MEHSAWSILEAPGAHPMDLPQLWPSLRITFAFRLPAPDSKTLESGGGLIVGGTTFWRLASPMTFDASTWRRPPHHMETKQASEGQEKGR